MFPQVSGTRERGNVETTYAEVPHQILGNIKASGSSTLGTPPGILQNLY